MSYEENEVKRFTLIKT